MFLGVSGLLWVVLTGGLGRLERDPGPRFSGEVSKLPLHRCLGFRV